MSPTFPLGVITLTLTAPGPEITSVETVTLSSWLLTAVAPSALPLTTISDDGTNWLPFTVSTKPCCTWEKLTVLGEIDPMSGAGRELPQNGFIELLQPARNNSERAMRDKRKGMGVLPPGSQLQSISLPEPW